MISYQFRGKGIPNQELAPLAAAAVREAERRMGAAGRGTPAALPGAPAPAPAPAPEAEAAPDAAPAPAPVAGAPPPPPPVSHATGQQVLSNLLAHIPSEAVALSTSLAPLVHDAANRVVPVRAWLVLLGALALTVLVRWLNNASLGVWVTSLVAFALWMCMVPGGALQVSFAAIASLQVEILIAAAIFSAIVTVLATAGKLR